MTTAFVAGTPITSTFLNNIQKTENINFTNTSTGGTAIPLRTKLMQYVHVNEFNPTANGTADDLVPLTNFFNSAIANPGVPHYLGNATYAISAALPTITASGVRIYGSGPTTVYDVGVSQGTTIKKITNAGGTMLTIAPVTGASAVRIDSPIVVGISWNGNQLAAKGVVIQSVRNGTFDFYAEECTTACYELGVVATLGEARDTQDCVFKLEGRNITNSAPVLSLTGDSGANVSLNRFEVVDLSHKDGTAMITAGSDNNIFDIVRIYRNAGGTATNSIEWRGGASDSLATRNETYCQLTTTVAAIAKGTGTYTVGAHDILIQTLDLGNSTPVPTVETGATVAGVWLTYTSTISATVGTITTKSAVARYKIDPLDLKSVDIQLAITITTNGTGATNLLATLPVTAENNSIYGSIPGKEIASTKKLVMGHVVVNTASLIMNFYDGTYPGADGYVIAMNGRYKKV